MDDPLKKLVMFIVMAIFGTIIAFVVYFAVELPIQQAALNAPAKAGHKDNPSQIPISTPTPFVKFISLSLFIPLLPQTTPCIL